MHPSLLIKLKQGLEQAKAEGDLVMQVLLTGDTLAAIRLAQQCIPCGICIILTGYEGTTSKMLYLVLADPAETDSVNFTENPSEKVLYCYPPTLAINQPMTSDPCEVIHFRSLASSN